MPDYLSYATLGLIAGFASGCFGVGGGAVIVPVLILVFRVPYHVAVGTSLALIIPISLAGSGANLFGGKVDWKIFWACCVSGILGALAGYAVIQKIPAEFAKKAFAVFLVYSAWRLWTSK